MITSRFYSCSGKIECCRWLLANKANIHAVDSSGRSPLDLAEVSSLDIAA